MKKLLVGVVISVVSVALVGCSSQNDKQESSHSTSSSTKKTSDSSKEFKLLIEQEPHIREEKIDKLANKIDELDLESYSSGIRVKSLIRDPSAHKGGKIYSLARIVQLINDPEEKYIYCMGYITYEKNDREYAMLAIPKDEVYVNILKDDDIRFWAVFSNSYEYTTQNGDRNTLPLLKVDAYQNDTAKQAESTNS